jgi:DNA-binding response OmpR family regulator
MFLSGAVERPNVRRGMEMGADDYLTKPFTPSELLAAVNARLEKQAEVERKSEKKLDEFRGKITLTLRGHADKLGVSRLYAHLFKAM